MDRRRPTLSIRYVASWLCCGTAALAIGWAAPASAQSLNVQASVIVPPFAQPVPAAPPQQTGTSQPVGRVADSTVGRAGQRQARAQAIGIKPMARINNRIPNRVQNRIYNRIDRHYDPSATVSSPFESAEERALRTKLR